MRTNLLRLAQICGLFAAAALHAASSNTVTIVASAGAYSSTGGTLTFAVTLNYASTVTVPALSMTAPAGWSFVSVTGPNAPPIAPQVGDVGEMNFAYIEAPANTASFSFTVKYPSSLTGGQVFDPIYAIFRPDAQPYNQPAITIGPAGN